uniref:Uncharacterized protein n=1 Tax=Candidatus Kentrum sp. LFY TaxID=2126342 RepID=A0A450UPZ4_9GAMM|nr:MAG: hypothetical protein BECKLFY1418A_GA0070994_104216 [Candidatus Kentron sp. LFY]
MRVNPCELTYERGYFAGPQASAWGAFSLRLPDRAPELELGHERRFSSDPCSYPRTGYHGGAKPSGWTARISFSGGPAEHDKQNDLGHDGCSMQYRSKETDSR